MFDNIGIQIENFPYEEFKLFVKMVDLEEPVKSEKMLLKWFNVRIEFYPNSRILKIKNSIHKLFSSITTGVPSNCSDFHFADYEFLVEYLMLALNRSSKEMKVFSNFEYGLNIDTGHSKPFDIISKYKSCTINSVNEFYTYPPKKGKPFERVCYFSDWRIKAYDKGIQAGFLDVKMLRFEIVITEIRKLKHILNYSNSITLHDLNDRNVWARLFEHMLFIYDRISKIPDLAGPVSLVNLNSIYNYSDKLMGQDISKGMNKNAYDKFRRSAKNIYFGYDSLPENTHNLIQKKLIEKFKDLYN